MSEYADEFRTLAESLAHTCADLMRERQAVRDWAGAAVVAELGDMAGHVLATLAKHTDAMAG
ncbi:MAG: hypothetical protein CVT65_14490 [Actinobacteria bacterium HGW-Actinobacteria-5]|nr:MAG: hypothetical protein CVT65_14490 [Actinobacteria bacterium HGW-Actinobacteria-5]